MLIMTDLDAADDNCAQLLEDESSNGPPLTEGEKEEEQLYKKHFAPRLPMVPSTK